MSHVLKYDQRYFRVEVAEVANQDEPGKPTYVAWCSAGFGDLTAAPSQPLSQFVAGAPQATEAAALEQAYQWIKNAADAPKSPAVHKSRPVNVVYTVWLFKGEHSFGFEFDEFSDAKLFAHAAETSSEVTKVGITNNESPQYLTIWNRA